MNDRSKHPNRPISTALAEIDVDDEVESAFGVSRSLPYLMTLRVLWLHRASGGGVLFTQLHYYAP